jgi:hypothetical protein
LLFTLTELVDGSSQVPDATEARSAGLVRFGRRQSRGLLLGFSGLRVTVIAAGIGVFVAAMFVAGMPGIAGTCLLWGGLIASAFVPVSGQPAIEIVPTALHYGARRVEGQLDYRFRPTAPRPAGTMALPGDAAALRFHVDGVTGAVLVHDPHARTITAIARITHPAFVLLSPDAQRQRVNGWGRVLAGVAASGMCARIQVLETALPDSGRGIAGWWAEHGRPDTSPWAAAQYAELLREAAPAASTHRTLIALTLDLAKAGKAIRQAGRGMNAAATVLRQHAAALEASLRAADLKLAGWLTDSDLAHVLRSAYDPATHVEIAGNLASAGPMGVSEAWDHMRHDSGFSRVLWISEWPRIEVAPSFLHALIFEPGVRKSVSLTCSPLSTAAAMRDIRRQKVEYVTDAGQKAKIGQLADLSDEQEYHDILDRERALIAGHADYRFSGFLTITAFSKEALESACAKVERAVTQCGCETLTLYGHQTRAFTVAALPLGRRAH